MINDTGLVVGIEHIKQLCEIGINNINKHHSNFAKGLFKSKLFRI